MKRSYTGLTSPTVRVTLTIEADGSVTIRRQVRGTDVIQTVKQVSRRAAANLLRKMKKFGIDKCDAS
jgi:hypothetical protein